VERSEFAIAMLDLDGFKPVNDRFGHAAGDEVLTVLANRLRGARQPGR
jgi:diguanylate cyclase (GGDEF)-like protein